MKTDQKYYNPYPFPVRVLNDLGDVFILEPQDYCKILNGRYSQSVLELPPVNEQREFHNDIGVEFEELKKSELIPLAWAVGLEGVDQKMTKSGIIKAITEEIGDEESYGDESDDRTSSGFGTEQEDEPEE